MNDPTGHGPDDPIVTDTDEPPSDGVWRDWDGAQLDPETVDRGNELGELIDIDDDDDNGGFE